MRSEIAKRILDKSRGVYTEHSGKRYTFTPKVAVFRIDGRVIGVKKKGFEAGVWIEDLKTGVKTWRPNSSYPHIAGLKFKDLTTKATITTAMPPEK